MKKTILLAALFSFAAESIASTSNQILLKSGSFTPSEGVSAFTKLSIETIPGRAHIIIQLKRIPTIQQRKKLEAQGIKLLSYIPNNAWFASIPSAQVEQIAKLPEVRAVCDIWAEDKVSPQIIDRGVAGHATNNDGTVNLTVQFFKDISLDEAALLITNYGGSIVGKAWIINALDITIANNLLPELANEDIVQWIDEFPPEPEILNDGSRAATGVDYVQDSPYDLNGVNIIVGEWDGGCVDDDHNDLKTADLSRKRVTQRNCAGSYAYHATHVAGTMLGNGYMSDKQPEAGDDCTNCPDLFPAGKTPKYITVTFFGIKDCKPYLPDDPPNNSYVLKQDDACIWHYVAINGIMQLDIWWRPWYYDEIHLYALSRTGGPWFKYESSVGCEKGYFVNDINLCGDNHGKNGMGYVAWQPFWPEGNSNQWKGMAPEANVISYLWWTTPSGANSDYNDAINNYGIDLSTNSWGFADWDGQYDLACMEVDEAVVGQFGKRITIIWSAGNEGDDFGWRSLRSNAVAKDIITVGATNSDNDSLWYESSLGPTADGRIKPDLVAPGCQAIPIEEDDGIVSTFPDNTYDILCGTSMAAPAVSGGAALMLQYWRQTHTQEPNILPSTIKALLIQTAKDLGNTGPDYSFGYGLIDVNEAVKLIGADDANNNVIMEDSIDDQNDKDLFNVDVPAGQNKLKITLVWDDYPAAPNPARALVNNLDLVVREPGGTRRYPWTLDPNNPSNPAETNKADHLNNVEQVEVNNPASGLWTVEVNGTNVPEPNQKYSLVSNLALEDCFPTCHPDYNKWVSVGKPHSWCWPRQCHGELNNATEVVAKITYWVGYADLNVFISQWLSQNTTADINHNTEVVAKITVRVGYADLNIFLANWLSNPDANCLDCPGLMKSQQAEQAIAEPVDIEALIKQLEGIWDTDQQIREQISESDWQKFIESLKEEPQN